MWLRAREAVHGAYRTLTALNGDLAVFAEHYNLRRPHRAHHGKTPATVFAATVKARPAQRPLPAATQIYHTHVGTGGTVTVSRPTSRGQLRVHVGARYKQLPVAVLRDGERVAIFTGTTLIRALDVDPTKIYQPLGHEKRATH